MRPGCRKASNKAHTATGLFVSSQSIAWDECFKGTLEATVVLDPCSSRTVHGASASMCKARHVSRAYLKDPTEGRMVHGYCITRVSLMARALLVSPLPNPWCMAQFFTA